MKLSEAILLGSVGSEQGFGPESIYSWNPRKCALGAALHAIGYMGVFCYEILHKRWPWVSEKPITCPACKDKHPFFTDITCVIYTLNDCHRWTRPQIAEWVASVEPQESKGNMLESMYQEEMTTSPSLGNGSTGASTVEQVTSPAPCING